MPSSTEILSGLTAIANDAMALAVLWHAIIATAIVALVRGWRPSSRRAAAGLAALPMTVSVLAFMYGNAFNGMLFAALTIALFAIGARFSSHQVRRSGVWPSRLGAAMVGFGLIYPHFLHARPLALYAVAAPTGLVPCPTLAVLVGFTLLIDGALSRSWATTLGSFGLVYGVVGVFKLGVALDVALIIGAVSLLTTARSAQHQGTPRSARRRLVTMKS
jgi:hypothetical protein